MPTQNKKTIVIDARIAVESKGHGIARYVYELICQLMNQGSHFKFVLLVNADSPFLKMKLPGNFRLQMMRSGWISFLGNLELSWILFKLKPDFYHSPSFIVPIFSRVPMVITIHDLIHVALADNYSWAHKFYYNVFLPYKMRRARKIITVSNFSKREILSFFKIDQSLVQVIYNGVNPIYSPTCQEKREEIAAFQEKYELPEEYILSMGNKKPHKNMARLVEAYCLGNFTYPLVLRTDFDPALLLIADKFNKRHAVHFLRFVNYEEFPYLYCKAKAFIYPSLYEGFGLPPVEAAACGVPVVVSDRTSLPEVMRESAFYVNPEDSKDICEGIQRALRSLENEHGKIEQGILLSERYSWEKVSSETLALYDDLVRKEGRLAPSTQV